MGLRNRTAFADEQCFFVTTTCHKWLKLLDSDAAFMIVADSLNFLLEKYHCHMLGYVLMPNHVHMILYFPEQNRLSDYMRDFKKFTSVALRKLIDSREDHTLLNAIRHETRGQKFKVWMDRFDDVYIGKKQVLHIKLDYIHNNPCSRIGSWLSLLRTINIPARHFMSVAGPPW